MARVRKDVWALEADANDLTLAWYARAVGVMQTRPIADHRSWRFQAAIHEYGGIDDPLAQPGEALPPQADQDRYWNQCQHNSWFFLPWHRMYLHHFEQIVRTEIIALGGPVDWALPYWNYSNGAASRRLPAAFRSPSLDNGDPNPLFVAARSPNANAGGDIADDVDADVSGLWASTFANPPGSGTPGFGGPVTAFNHGGGPIGAVEWSPHALMHVAVGGDAVPGWMSQFFTAALDPIFWLHHANIDRLWDVWIARDATHTNPTSPFWRTGVEFPFRGVDGAHVAMTCAQVLDATAQPLDYRYDDISDPFAGPTPVRSISRGATEGTMAENRVTELVGATQDAIVLGGEVKRAVVPTRAARSVTAPSRSALTQRVFLHIEHLTSDDGAASYDVYLGLPPGADPKAYPENRVGRLPMFGLREASRAGGPHAGSGITVALEVTGMIDRLRNEPGWDPDQLPISFVPVHASTTARVRVGRVSLYTE